MHNTILNIVILIVSHNIACNFSFLFQKKKKKKSDLINSHDLRSKHNQQKSKRSEHHASVASISRVEDLWCAVSPKGRSVKRWISLNF